MTDETRVTAEEVLAELMTLRTEMTRQRESLTQQLERSQEENRALYAEIDRLRNLDAATSQVTMPIPTATSAPTVKSDQTPVRADTGPAVTPSSNPSPRPRYPDVEPFNGEDIRDYRAFRINLYTKFLVDRHCFYSDEEKILYAFSRLRSKASQRILPWIAAKQGSSQQPTLDEFYTALDQAFSDPEIQRKALVRVNTMKQGKRDFEEFLTEFDGALIDAGGLLWDDSQKKALLDTAISRTILEGTIGVEQPASYEGYCNQLRRINHQQQRIARLSQKGKNFVSPPPRTGKGGTSAGPDTMDWESTAAQVAALQGQLAALRTESSKGAKRATWVSNIEIQKRRSSWKCLRCGSDGHIVRKCPMLPARRPGQVAAVQTPAVQTPQNPQEPEETDSDESEKE